MATTVSMTLAEFAALSDEPGKQELIRGELVCTPPPKRRVTAYSAGRFEISEMPAGVLSCERLPGLRIPLSAIFS